MSTSGALDLTGCRTGLSVLGAIEGETLVFFIEELLAPTLKRGDLVVMDNCPIHKDGGERRPHCSLRGLGPVSPAVLAGSEPHSTRLVKSEGPPAGAQAPDPGGCTGGVG